MPAQQLAAIRSVLREVFEAPAEQNWCVTFEAAGNENYWVQVVLGSINAAYPHDDDPLGRLEGLGLSGPVQELIAFEASMYATFILLEATAPAAAEFVDAWFTTILELGHDYKVDFSAEDLG